MQSKLNLIHKILALSIKINHTKKKTVWCDFMGHVGGGFCVRYCDGIWVPSKENEYSEIVYLEQSPVEYFEKMYNHLKDLYEEITEGNYAE